MIAIESLRLSATAAAALLFFYVGSGGESVGVPAWTAALLGVVLVGSWAALPFVSGHFRRSRSRAVRAANRFLFCAVLAIVAWFAVELRAAAWSVISVTVLSFVIWNTTTFVLFHRSFDPAAVLPRHLVNRYLAGLAAMTGAGAILAGTAEAARRLLQSAHIGVPAPVLLISAVVVAIAVRRFAAVTRGGGIVHSHGMKPVPEHSGQK